MATRRYRVTALYDSPPVERSALIEADTPERAMAKSVLEGWLPVAFRRDVHGWLEPVMWHAELGGARRWPLVLKDRIEWGEGPRQQLRFYVTEEHGEGGDA